ncbi:MAG: glycosyltransferase family 39 protein [Betaproteobacteria bacterium]|nr:glycosyltransferase family 39 protein [Betaproteobacteria bacterium]
MTRPRLPLILLLVAIFCAVWFANLDTRSLIRPDEGRYAEIAREMAVSGDWVTPRLNGLKYFEKPPLQYWVTAAAFRMFGPDEWTARLWPALTGVLCVLAVWRIGRRLFGEPAGAYAALVAGSMLWMVANAHLNSLDMGLTFFLTVCAGALLVAQQRRTAVESRRRWMAAAWVACAGALLTKGLIGIVLPGGAITFYLLATRDWRLLTRLHIPAGLVVLLLIAAPWFVAVSLANPEFPEFFFVREHFQRYLTTVHRRSEPWWTFAPMLIAGTLPWVVLAARSVWRAHGQDDLAAPLRPRLYLLCWIVFVFLFFSASSSKLPSYILPLFPALAWLMGDRLANLPARELRWHAVPLLPLAIAAGVLGLRAERFANERTPVALYQAFEPWIVGAAIAMGVGSLLCMVWSSRGRKAAAATALGFGGLVAWQAAITGHDALSPSFSAARFARQTKPLIRPDCPLYSVRTYDQTLPFYLERTVTLVAFSDEMTFGVEREPQRWIPDMDGFAARWREGGCEYAFMEPAVFDELTAAGLPMQIVGRDTRRVLVAHPGMEITPLP